MKRASELINNAIAFLNRVFELTFFTVGYILLYIVLFAGDKFPISNNYKIVFLALTLASSQSFMALSKSGFLSIVLRGRNIASITLLILYVSFSSVGNFLFLNPASPLSLSAWLYFILFTFWVLPTVVSILYVFYSCGTQQGRSRKNLGNKKNAAAWTLFFLALAASWMLYLIAFNPAILSWDSFDQWAQARGLTPLLNWHPVVHTLLIRLMISIVPSPSIIAFCQIIFLASVSAGFLSVLYKRGIGLVFLLAASVAFALIPTNGIHIVTLWKDIPYSISLLWLTLIFSKIVSRASAYTRSLEFNLEILPSLLCVYFFRQNGIVVYILASIALLSLLIMRRQARTAGTIVLSAILILIIQFPVYRALSVESPPRGNKYIALVNDIAGAYIAGGDVSEGTATFLREVLDFDNYKKNYSPYWAASGNLRPALNDIELGGFLKLYLDTLLRNPALMINNILCRMDIYWNITTGKGGLIGTQNYTGYATPALPEWESIKFTRNENLLTKAFSRASTITANARLFVVFFWRHGIWISLLLIAICSQAIKGRGRMAILALPLFGNILSLLLSSGWMDYRYGWSIFITVPFVLLFLLSEGADHPPAPPEKARI